MAKTFSYKARDIQGQRLSGNIVADSQSAVAAFIRDKGWFVTQIKEQQRLRDLNIDLRNFKSVGVKDLAIFCRLFATLSGAGVSFVKCLAVLQEQTEHPRLKQAVNDIYKRVREGETLAKAMRNHSKIFPELMVGMVEAGEAGGVLDVILQRLAILFEKEYKAKEKVKSALVYPLLVTLLGGGLVLFILTFVLPTFVRIFDGSRIELPAITKAVIATSLFCQVHWLATLLLVLSAMPLLAIGSRNQNVRYIMDSLALKAPLFGVLVRNLAIARFTHTLAILMRSGLSILTALEMARQTTDNCYMLQILETAKNNVKQGEMFATALSKQKIFPVMVIQMISVGEEAGEMESMLEKISEFYEAEVDETVRRLSTLIEPMLIIFLGVFIGGIVMSVMLPLFDLTMNLGQ